MNWPWILLAIAGLLEVVWAVGLKYTEGFTRPWVSAGVVAAIVASMTLLGLALKSLPVGTAYAVWVGIGVAGTAVCGMILFREPATALRLFFLALMIASIAGLKATSGAG